jgi:hypothetical protein
MAATLGLAITLSVTYEITAERLVVTYVVTNTGRQSVYLLDKSFKATAEGIAPRDDSLLVSFEPPETLVLAGKLLPIKPGMTFATPPTALGTLLKPGEKVATKTSVALPIHFDKTATEPKEVSCRQVRFELGYVADAPELAAKPTNLKQVFALAPAAWAKQAVIQSGAQKIDVKGLVAPKAPNPPPEKK